MSVGVMQSDCHHAQLGVSMSRKRACSSNIVSVAAFSTFFSLTACSGVDAGTINETGGNTSNTAGSGGTAGAATGGNQGVGGNTNGGNISTGGVMAVGGSTAVGGTKTTGGNPSTGGNLPTGGNPAAGGTGGNLTTGGTVSTGGSNASAGGMNTGGAVTTGGSRATGGTVSTGGSRNTGGSSATGGASGTGGATGTNTACPGADAAEFALIQAWLNNTTAVGALPSYAYSNIKTYFPATNATTPQFTFNRLACTIAMTCVEFAPMETNWLRKCEAVLTSAIVAESSYNPNSSVASPANDPTVGLLQIRFSSTVKDYNYNGPMTKMAAIGCNWPAELLTLSSSSANWTTLGQLGSPVGAAPYVYNAASFMQDPACNIALAGWYYFYNATANGGASNSNVVWIANYCAGQGIAGNMLYGLDSHLDGGSGISRSGTAGTLTWSNLGTGGDLTYPWGIECCACGAPTGSCATTCTASGCTGRFAAFMGIGTTAAHPSPDPFWRC